MNYYILLCVSLGLNCVLLTILCSPNLNYFFNKKWFVWRNKHMSFEDWKKSEGFVSYHANKKDSFQLTTVYTNDMFANISEEKIRQLYESYLKTSLSDILVNDQNNISQDEYRIKVMNKLKIDHE